MTIIVPLWLLWVFIVLVSISTALNIIRIVYQRRLTRAREALVQLSTQTVQRKRAPAKK